MIFLKRLVKNVNAIQTAGASNLVKKAGQNRKIGEIEKKTHSPSKYITTPEFNS